MKTNQLVATIQLPVSEEHGIPVLADFLTEIQRQFDVEKNLKNAAFIFLCSKGLYQEFHDQLHTGKLCDDFQGRVNAAITYLAKESEVCDV